MKLDTYKKQTTLFNENGRLPIAVFDFDGNIIAPNSKLKFWNNKTQKYEYVGVLEFESNPQKFLTGDTYDYPKYFESHFENLRDFSNYNPEHMGPDVLLEDSLRAIEEGKLSPSISYLKGLLIEGRVAAILTARGHGAGNFERVMRMLSKELLTPEEELQQIENVKKNFNLEGKKTRQILDYYFQHVLTYMSVSNTHDMKMQGINKDLGVERKKAIMLKKYVTSIVPHILSHNTGITKSEAKKLPYAVGFSDDSYKNIVEMVGYFSKKLSKGKFNENYKMRFYYTGKDKHLDEIDAAVKKANKLLFCERVKEKQGGNMVWKIRLVV